MDQAVECSSKPRLAALRLFYIIAMLSENSNFNLFTWRPAGHYPPNYEHCRMMKYVKKRHLIKAFSYNHKNCVEQFNGFRKKVKPQRVCNLECKLKCD